MKQFSDEAILRIRKVLQDRLSSFVELEKSFVIELGSGNGRMGKVISSLVKEYLGVDKDEGLVDIANSINRDKNAKFVFGEMESFSSSEKADILFYPLSFWFSKDFNAVFKNATKLLRDDGIIFIILKRKEPRGWADSTLNKDSKNYNEGVYLRNVAKIAKAESYLRDNDYFEIVKEFSMKLGDCFILKRK